MLNNIREMFVYSSVQSRHYACVDTYISTEQQSHTSASSGYFWDIEHSGHIILYDFPYLPNGFFFYNL